MDSIAGHRCRTESATEGFTHLVNLRRLQWQAECQYCPGMTHGQNGTSDAPTLHDLYPTLSDEELKKAEINLSRYLELAFEIHQERAKTPAMR